MKTICILIFTLLIGISFISCEEEQNAVSGEAAPDDEIDDGSGNGDDSDAPVEEDGRPTTSSDFLNTLMKSKNIVYIKSKKLVDDGKREFVAGLTDKETTLDDDIYLIDFTDTKGTSEEKRVRKVVSRSVGISIPCDLLLVSPYKGTVLFTPIANKTRPDIAPVFDTKRLEKIMEDFQKEILKKKKAKKASARSADTKAKAPMVNFYIHLDHQIADCHFKRTAHGWYSGTRFATLDLCQNPHISVIFQVTLQRSLKFGTSIGPTPDVKIVRISADKDAGGAGIHLNSELRKVRTRKPHPYLDDYVYDFVSSAIADSYTVTIGATNSKARVLKTEPRGNKNPKTTVTETSGFTVGVSAGAEASEEGPKASLGASASYTESRAISFNTQDYKMHTSTDRRNEVKYKYQRETYKKAEDLLTKGSGEAYRDQPVFPVDFGRVEHMGYARFVPQWDVIFSAKNDTTGTTSFRVSMNVMKKALYHGAYRHYYVFAWHWSYHGFDPEPKPSTANVEFTVDWDHPVFTGGRPVNLQSRAYSNKCIKVSPQNRAVTLEEGDLSSSLQSFIFDDLKRYVSVTDADYCLDGSDLSALQQCSSSLWQQWRWEKGTDSLFNDFETSKKLGVDTRTGNLGLYETDSDTINTKFITRHTTVFETIQLHKRFWNTNKA